MFVKRALGLGLLALTGVAVAQQGLHTPRGEQVAAPGSGGNQLLGRMYTPDDLAALRASAAEVAALVNVARKPLRKMATEQLQIPPEPTGQIIFKVADVHQSLLQGDGTLLSLADSDLGSVQQVIQQFGLAVRPAVRKEPQRLIALQRRATENSGTGQSWLAGMLIAEGPQGNLLEAARALNDLDVVEWVEIEAQLRPMQPATGACCLPNSICSDNVTAIDCQGFGGEWQGPGTTCGGLACGACCLPAGSCTTASPDVCTAFAGTFQGAAVPCEPTTCDVSACCLPDFTCTVTTTALCSAMGGNLRVGITECGGAACGACCFGDEDAATCIDPNTQAECEATPDFIAFVPNATCADDPDPCADLDPDCGVPGTGDCFDPEGNGTPFCDDLLCCTLICDTDPFCCDEEIGLWDPFCAQQATVFCAGGDSCGSPLGGSCYDSTICESGGFQYGCSDEVCCNAVCAVEPLCCDRNFGCWDQECVNLAVELCAAPPAGADTPELTPYQGYRTPGPYDLADVPDLVGLLPIANGVPLWGFGGEGFNLMAGEPFEDLNDNDVRDPGEPYKDWNGDGTHTPGNSYAGLYGLAQELLEVYGVNAMGQGNLSLGKTIRVAVIEWAYWQGHEDLDVISEPGQTLITIPDVTSPDHATACLSIINAKPNGIGMTGIAPQAQAYFFPLTSVEEGPRQLDAWTSAIETLRPGDVISCSYGPGAPYYNLNNAPSTHEMISLASATGITCCVSAGNDCFNLDGAEDRGADSGGVVVGACSPGIPWYRLDFSNYYQGEPDTTRSNMVHVKAWGTIVSSGGYAGLFNGQPVPDRSYTPAFNGTSAAAPQIAGLAACLQGLAKQFYGIPLTAPQIRAAMGGNESWVPPDPCSRFLVNCGFSGPCGWDFNPDEGPNLCGPYPDPRGSGASILSQSGFGFQDNPLVDEIQILVGTLVFGNVFSIKESDNNHLIISSALTTPGGNEVSKRGDIITGNVTDVMIRGHTEFPRVDSLAITTETFVTGGAGVVLLYVYSWEFNRWLVGGIGVLTGLPDERLTFELGNADQFIQNNTKLVLFRIQTVSSAFGPTYEAFHDEIVLEAGGDPMVPSDGP